MHRRITVLTLEVIRNPPIIPSRKNPFYSQFNPFAWGANGLTSFRFFSFTLVHRRVSDPDDPANLMKEDGESVCSQMWIENFREPDMLVSNLTSYLCRFELWVLAYQKVCADEIGSFVPRSSITRSTLDDLLALRNDVLDNRFKWGARLEFFIKSPKDKTDYESLSKMKIKAILTTTQPAPFQDKLVQEVLLMILEPIYEASFSHKSFAFRPGRNAHTVLRVIRRIFAVLLMERKRRKRNRGKYQKKVLAEDEPKPDPYWLETFFGFAPQEAEKLPSWGHCGILSPLLTNICLDELDRWMKSKIKDFYCPSKSDVIWNSFEGEAEQRNTSWPEFIPTSGPDKTRKMDYIRYGGHILIGIGGPRADAATLRKQLIQFCDQKYMIKLDNESLSIEHITKGIMFLDHVLCRRVVYPTLRYTATGGKIISEKGVGTLLFVTASLKQCIKQFRKNLSRPLNERKGQSPEYQNLLRMGLAESIDGLQYTRMSLIPETDYTPFPSNWNDDPKTLEEQRSCIREHGLISLQDYISMLVWNYKRDAIVMDQLSLVKSAINSSKGDDENYDTESKDEEACALSNSWCPMLTGPSEGAPQLKPVAKEGINGTFFSWVTATRFLTGASAIGSIAVPAILKHAGVIECPIDKARAHQNRAKCSYVSGYLACSSSYEPDFEDHTPGAWHLKQSGHHWTRLLFGFELPNNQE
ncbi:regulator of nonsense transcripts 1-like protein [Hibiscus syriacus]|uniref:Regulator of nonsense transcripts 1-like protein n=1 Tax=Hibiscus syriacus TaxID=106335 RepID=A0A6A3CLC1_HIBSY|nr:regulator of nonsense transcripts 1-like protein [Hibiscus syriacus]